MKLKTNACYNVKYLPSKRHRNEKIWNTYVEFDVEIKEPTEVEFPVAFIASENQTVYPGAKDVKEFLGNGEYRKVSKEIRLFNGVLYESIKIGYGTTVSTEYETINQVSSRYNEEIFYCTNKPYDDEKAIILSSNKEDMIQEKTLYLEENLLYFDNHFWMRCGEPCYTYDTFGLGNNHGGTALFTIQTLSPDNVSESVFNANDYEKAIEHTIQVALNRGDTESVEAIKSHDKIEVLIPEAVTIRSRETLEAEIVKKESFLKQQVQISLSIKEAYFISILLKEDWQITAHEIAERLENAISEEKQKKEDC